jgi:hypothetical protein
MNLRQFVPLFATLLLGATLSTSALAVGGHGGGGHGGGHGGGGHGVGHGGGHSGGGHRGGGHRGGGHRGGGGHGHHGGGGHFGLGVFIGPSFGWYYPGPSYYYPSRAGTPSGPPVYFEQGGEINAAQQAYWYYCAESKTYYPYVKQCLGEWQRVPAQPPPNP